MAKFRILSTALIENGLQFTSNLFGEVCQELTVNQKTTTKYHALANRQVERFKLTMISLLRHYVAEIQEDWGTIVFLFMYVQIVHVQSSIKVTPLSLLSGREPIGRNAGNGGRMPPDVQDAKSPMDYRNRLTNEAALLRMLANKNLENDLGKFKVDHNKRSCFEPRFAPGGFVFIKPPQLFASAAERMESKGYGKLIPGRTAPTR